MMSAINASVRTAVWHHLFWLCVYVVMIIWSVGIAKVWLDNVEGYPEALWYFSLSVLFYLTMIMRKYIAIRDIYAKRKLSEVQ